MLVYIIKDNNDILGVYKKLNDAYDYILFINNYIISKCNGKNIINILKIYKYNNNILKKIYYIDNNLKLIEENINYNKLYNTDNIENIIESSEINIFIPNETDNINDLQEKISLLEKLQQDEIKKLNELKNNFVNKEEKYIEEKVKIDNKKLKLKQEQEKWDTIKKKFEADKKLYFVFKNEINEGKRKNEEIPELFKDIYPIFDKLDNDGYLNTLQEINQYVELTTNN
jgi:hypothetical protein